MQSVQQIAEDIVAREGGYVNDPDDPGGATNHGVTLATMQRLGLDVTSDGRVSVADVRALSRAQAVDIFVTHYFTTPQIGDLPAELQPSVFDMYVNAGGNAVKILQRLLCEMGYHVVVDGSIGPQTATAAQSAAAVNALAFRMLTGWRGETTISVWRIAEWQVGNLPGPGPVPKAVGFAAPKSFCRRAFI